MSAGKVNPFEYFISGGFGGIVNVLVGHPFDTLKVRLQTMPLPKPGEKPLYEGTWDCVQQTVKKEGPFGLYKGIQAPLTGVAPIFAISFLGYGVGKKIFNSEQYPKSVLRIFGAGAFSALGTALIISPIERVKTLLQVQGNGGEKRYNGMADCFTKLYKEGGIRSVYKGLVATLARDIPAAAIYFATYHKITLSVTKEGELPSSLWSIIAGGTAGIVHWVVGMPADVIKSRLQASSSEGGTFVSVLTELLNKEGPTALYKGVIPVMLRAFPANAACFLGFETCQKMFAALHRFFDGTPQKSPGKKKK